MQVFRKKPLLVNTSGDERKNYMPKKKGHAVSRFCFRDTAQYCKNNKKYRYTAGVYVCVFVPIPIRRYDHKTTATTLLTHNRYNVRYNRISHSPRIGPYDPGSVSRKNHHFLVTAWFVVVAVAVRFGRVSYCDSSPSRWYYWQSWCGGGCRYWSCRVCNCPQ